MDEYHQKRLLIQKRLELAGLETPADDPGGLSHAVMDIAEASQKILDLIENIISSEKDTEESIYALTEELSHIVYHICDARYFKERVRFPE